MATTELRTPTAMITRLRGSRATEVAAQVDQFVLATEWADAHPDTFERTGGGACIHGCPSTGGPDDSPWDAAEQGDFGGGCVRGCVSDAEGFGDPFIPATRWDAAASFATALGHTTQWGSLFIRDALIVRHRLPLLWQRVIAGEVEPWRARRIAQAVIGRPRDVSDWLDGRVTPVAHQVGSVGLDRLVDEALLRLYPEQREADQLAALDARFARLDPGSINHTGLADMAIRGDWKDLADFDDALARVAAALAVRDASEGLPADSLDVRRSRAVGVLADPAQALALLAQSGADTRPTPAKQVQLVLHVTPDHLAGLDPVARNATTGRPVLEQAVRDWCGRTDTHLQVLPVLDLAGHDHTAAYEISGRTRTRVEHLAGTCVFPFCTKPARRCDKDHVVAFSHADPAAGGASCDCNIAPLCRHHHQLKTHAGWRYTPLETGVWLWSDPHGQQFLRDHTGTTDVTGSPRERPMAGGCRRSHAPPGRGG